MKPQLGTRFWLESVLASVTGFLGVLTMFWRDWIEGISGFDPDHHSGSTEWAIVAVLLVIAVTAAAFARTEYVRRTQLAHSAA